MAQQKAMPELMGMVQDQLDAMFRGVKGITYKRGHSEVVNESQPLVEPDDMVIVASPCHAYEPVKVPADHRGQLHCLVCGSAFAV